MSFFAAGAYAVMGSEKERNEKGRDYWDMSVLSAEKTGSCIIRIGSVNAALRAQRALSADGIPAAVVKSESGREDGGCVYGVSVICLHWQAATAALRAHGIRIREP